MYKRLSIRIVPALSERINMVANKIGISINQVILVLIDAGLSQFEVHKEE